MKNRKVTLFVLVSIPVTIFLFLLIRNNYSFKEKLIELEFRGIIEDIERRENHGILYFRVNGNWHSFGTYGDKIHRFATVGDSLVKISGEAHVILFRKNEFGEFEVHKMVKLSTYPLQPLE